MKNLIKSEISLQKNNDIEVKFTPLCSNKFRCNLCWQKLKKNKLETHKSTHRKPEKNDSLSLIQKINKDVWFVLSELKITKQNSISERNFINILNKKWILNKIIKIKRNIEELNHTGKNGNNYDDFIKITKSEQDLYINS